MRRQSCAAALAVAACLPVSVRQGEAATTDITLTCHVPTSAGAGTWTVTEESDASPVLYTHGSDFGYASDEEAFCQFQVPTDYYGSSATEPSVTILGYSRECVICCCGDCGTTRKSKFKVSSKALRDGYSISQSWGAEESDEESYTSQACTGICASNCYEDNEARALTADATNDASNWQGGDTVLIRILRDTGVTNNLSSEFRVTGVRLTYPLD